MKVFEKENLGVDALSREGWFENNSNISKQQFAENNEQFIFVADRTFAIPCYMTMLFKRKP
jgi:hypothetical protein